MSERKDEKWRFLREKGSETADFARENEGSFGEREKASGRGRRCARKTMSCRGGF